MYRLHDEINWSAVATKAQGLLSSTQIIALQQFVEQKRIDSEINAILNPSTK